MAKNKRPTALSRARTDATYWQAVYQEVYDKYVASSINARQNLDNLVRSEKTVTEQADKIAEQWRTINELNRKVGDLTSCNDAYGELLKHNQEANEAASARIESLKAELEFVKGQLSTALAHREALLDAAATVRFVMEQKALGKL